MMRKIILGLACSMLVLSSCKKEEGCMEGVADNYNSDAEVSDGSCTYSAELNMWWSESYALLNESDGFTVIEIYFDEVLVDTETITSYFAAEPTCGEGISKAFDLSGEKSKSVVIKVTLTGSTIYEDYSEEVTVTLSADNTCLNYKWN